MVRRRRCVDGRAPHGKRQQFSMKGVHWTAFWRHSPPTTANALRADDTFYCFCFVGDCYNIIQRAHNPLKNSTSWRRLKAEERSHANTAKRRCCKLRFAYPRYIFPIFCFAMTPPAITLDKHWRDASLARALSPRTPCDNHNKWVKANCGRERGVQRWRRRRARIVDDETGLEKEDEAVMGFD